MFLSALTAFWPYLSGGALAIGTVLILSQQAGRGERSGAGYSPDNLSGDVFVLNQGKLVHSNFSGRRQLDVVGGPPNPDARLRKLLSSRFSGIDRLLDTAGNEAGLVAASRDGQLQIIREVAGEDVRLEIRSRENDAPGARDIYCLNAAADELQMLRVNTEVAPFLLWRQTGAGDVTWANRAYLDAATEVFGADRVAVWPLPSIFGDLKNARPETGGQLKRLQAAQRTNGGEAAWYDCHMTKIGPDILCTAFQADEAVRNERRRHEFTQTLTKTFADLSIGLAIFDRSRRLVLFNPSLSDLTTLPPDFLSSRPSMVDFLDRLRENRMMVEPKDYRAWRNSIAELESAARDGTYSETWALPDGRTYRISGRPHPDGALALLFEDISAEISLTRRFRAQLQQSNNVIDALDEAVVIFARNGEMTFANTAYKALWGESDVDSVLGTTVLEATKLWHAKTTPTPIWGDFREFVLQENRRSEWSATVTLKDGRQVLCRFVPQKARATLALFRTIETKPESLGDLRAAV